MTREEAKKLLPIIKAFSDGETIQHLDIINDKWEDVDEFVYHGRVKSYRIKPDSQPKFRPFKDAEECWAEMYKHEPFGWLTSQNGEVNSLIIAIDNEGLIIGDRNNGVMGFTTATDLFKIKFADGVPFGVKVEE